MIASDGVQQGRGRGLNIHAEWYKARSCFFWCTKDTIYNVCANCMMLGRFVGAIGYGYVPEAITIPFASDNDGVVLDDLDVVLGENCDAVIITQLCN